MTDHDTVLRFRAPADRDLRARLYRALAQELLGSDGPATVLVESTTDGFPPELTVRPACLVGPTFAAPAFRTLDRHRLAPPTVADRPSGPVTTTWALLRWGAEGALATPPAIWDVPEALALLGPGGRLDAQTFWTSGRSDGRLWAARRLRFRAPTTEALASRASAVAAFASAEWTRATSLACRAVRMRRSERAWTTGASRSLPRQAWLALSAALADRASEMALLDGPRASIESGHTVALGAPGAGKTTFLAECAARAMRHGQAVLAVDLHGDLAPAITRRLSPGELARTVGVDAGRRPVAGVAALAGQSDRTAAQFVAAVKRLSPDGTDVYWGFRLERIFDAFVRLVQESGGTVEDLYALLTDADRRETVRLATRHPELARFLDELGPIVRRTPEFLWPAAARLAKVVLVPELAELLAPRNGGIPVEELLEARRSLVVRLPFASVGPEAAAFAGSLLLARIYLGVAARRGPEGPHAPIVVVLDEVQGLSPRLVAEMLTEGRKFGLRLVIASQYPERLAPELRLAAAGAGRNVVAFRVPRAGASEVGGWLGLTPAEAQRVLADLPVGLGVSRANGTGELRTVPSGGAFSSPTEASWNDTVERTLAEFPVDPSLDRTSLDEATERLLLAILAREEQGAPLPHADLVSAALQLPGPPLDRVVVEDRAAALARESLADEVVGAWHLTPAGERRLGLRATTGATKESDVHRALLLRSFRLFARRGHQLEIVRQGRYDTTLPDAFLPQIPERIRNAPPQELARTLASVQQGWAWRFFGGQDVHVEVEVSGALRPQRIRHGLTKARRRGAFALFVVAEAAKASRVRRTLRAEGWSVQQAQVWTLRPWSVPDRGGTPREGKPAERSSSL